MPKHLTVIEPIPLPDVRTPAKLTSLPQWLTELLGLLKKELQPDETGRYREVQVLPIERSLSVPQTAVIGGHLSSLGKLFEMTPENGDSHAKATMTSVSKMLMTLGGRETGKLGTSAKSEAYMMALDDVPSWAVEAAVRRWYRGECGDHDYRWPPAPADLRELARLEMFRVKGVGRRLQDLLDAKPAAVPVDREKAAEMRAKLRGIGLVVDNQEAAQ